MDDQRNCQTSQKEKHLYRNYRLTRELQTYDRYKEVDAHVKEFIRDSVRRFEMKLGENTKQDSKSFYKYVKSKQQVKDSIGPLRWQTGDVSSDSKFMAEELNNFFAQYKVSRKYSDQKLTDINITLELVRKHLIKLKMNKAPGPGTLGSSFLVDICDQVAKPLSIIFNLSLNVKQVPSDWKHANVTPIFKKGDKF